MRRTLPLLAFLGACTATVPSQSIIATDIEVTVPVSAGARANAVFRNPFPGPVTIGDLGCHTLVERMEPRGGWVGVAPDGSDGCYTVERVVAAGESLAFGIVAPRAPGIYRLTVMAGFGQDAIGLLSKPFQVNAAAPVAP